ncbi:MAG: hypothetical protein IJC09_02970 [Clostridia bacterium]|nr:hypothetical protein [Clostridia bacterium]
MTLQKLKEYLKTVHELEKTKYENELLMDNVKSINYEAKLLEPQKIEVKEDDKVNQGYRCSGLFVGAISGFVLYLIISGTEVSGTNVIEGSLLGAVCTTIIFTIIGGIIDSVIYKSEQDEKNKKLLKSMQRTMH